MTNAALKMPKSPVSYQPKPDFVERDYQTQSSAGASSGCCFEQAQVTSRGYIPVM